MHLGDSLQVQWRRYRKRLKRCQERFSEEAVHASRVETRRLLATVELLRAFIPEDDLKKARRALKHPPGHLRSTPRYAKSTWGMSAGSRDRFRWQAPSTHGCANARPGSPGKPGAPSSHIKTRRLGRRIDAFPEPGSTACAKALRAPARSKRRCAPSIGLSHGRPILPPRQAAGHGDDSSHAHCLQRGFDNMMDALSPLLPAVTDQQPQRYARLPVDDGRHPGRGSPAGGAGKIHSEPGD